MAQAAQAAVDPGDRGPHRRRPARGSPTSSRARWSCTGRAAQDLFLRASNVAASTRSWLTRGRRVPSTPARSTSSSPRPCPPRPGTAGAVIVADAVQRAGELTAPQLARHVRAAVIGADAAAAERRRVKERADRGVEIRPADHAMAWFMRLPARRARHRRVHRHRRARRARRHRRRRPHRRPAARGRVHRRLHRHPGPADHPRRDARCPRRHGQRVALQVTVAATTLAGLDDQPGHLGSYGPIPAQVARELAQDATWRRLLTDPVGRVCSTSGPTTYRPGADLTRTDPGARRDLHVPRLPPARHPVRDRPPRRRTTTAGRRATRTAVSTVTRATSPATHRPARRTSTRCASTTTRRRPAAGGASPTTATTGISTWTDRHGLTYARHPVRLLTTAQAVDHRPPPPPPPPPRDWGDPPF